MAMIKEVISVTGVRCRFFDDDILTDPKMIEAGEERQKELLRRGYARLDRRAQEAEKQK